MENQDPQPVEENFTINGDQFTLPPLLRRRFVIELDIPRASFDERALPLMKELLEKEHFSTTEMRQKWEFRLKIDNLVPRPKLRLTQSPAVVRNQQGSGSKTVLELFPPVDQQAARFILEQDYTDAHPTRFKDLECDIHRWLPGVMERFEVDKVGGFAILYQNEFRRSRYPEFWEEEKSLLLGKLLKLFQNDYEGDGFVTPLLIELNTNTGLPHSKILFQMRTADEPGKEVALNLNLEFTSLGREQRVAIDSAWSELREAHALLFDNFVRHLSPEALAAFSR